MSTGSTSSHRLKIREVDLDGNVLRTHTITGSMNAGPSSIGNSLLHDGQRLLLFSATGPRTGALTRNELSPDFALVSTQQYYDPELEQHFPVSSLYHRGFTFIGYIGRPRGNFDIMSNPYSPYLKVLDPTGQAVIDLKVGDKGMAHVHPTLALVGNRLLVAWSKLDGGSGNQMRPWSRVEEYELTWQEASQTPLKRPATWSEQPAGAGREAGYLYCRRRSGHGCRGGIRHGQHAAAGRYRWRLPDTRPERSMLP